ncbi:plexin-A2-like, partial [Crassostrea angulata]|uniref:plexin-A2-like n=1 Tax=Magallana angulata TaxID=2784310 RepID=UPI0022B1C768
MKASVIFQILCTLWFCLIILSEGQIVGKLETQFKNPLENFPLLNIEFDHQTRNVFVSGKNILYRFRMYGTKLIKKMTRNTGPVVDCFPQLSSVEFKEYCGHDYNTVMVVTPDSLITCGTLRGGLCLTRDKVSLNITLTSPDVRLVSDEQASALGIFLNITDKNSPGMFQNIVLFAKEYTTLPLSPVNLEEAAIFSVLPDLSHKQIGFSKFGKIFDMVLRTPVNVVMDYRVAIENEKFVFLLVNQNSQSKFVKVCKSIVSEDPKKVYEDIPISCNSQETILTHVKHGMFITLFGKRYLITLFSSSKPTLSAMCVFEENEIYQAFLKSRKHRYMCPKNDIRPEEMIFDKDNRLPTCISVNLSVSNFYDTFHKGDYCNDVTNNQPQFGIIMGLLPLQGNAVYSTKSHRVTVAGSSTINNLTTVYIGTDNGYVIQVFYDAVKKVVIELREIRVDKSEIRAVRNVNGEIYFMSQNKISKWIQETQCGRYSDNCMQCMDVRDANCGWCVTNTRCSTKIECSSLSPDSWLPSVKKECLSLEFQNHPSGFVYKLDGTNTVSVNLSVTFKPPLKANYNMRCRLGGRSIPTVFVSDKIQCIIEPRDEQSIMLSYREEETPLQIWLNGNVIAERQILFIKCSSFPSCGSCIAETRLDCYWCTEEAVCKPSRSSCINNLKSYFFFYFKVTACPQILNQTVSIPTGRSRTFVFRGNNLNVPKDFTYWCKVGVSGTFRGRRIPGTNNIQCLNIKTVREEYTPIEIEYGPGGNVPLEVFDGFIFLYAYKCESLSPYKEDCSTCHHLDQSMGYECQWCQRTGCVDIDNDQCRRVETCGGPVVTKISPKDGPPEGGTVVTIEGFNFGIQSFVTVTVAGVPCNNATFIGRRINCNTSHNFFDSTKNSEKSGHVIVMVDGKKSSEDIQFTYKMPKITSIYPSQGILSGGRTVFLKGTNLNIGNMEYAVEFINIDVFKPYVSVGCTIIKGLSGIGDITCKPNKAVDVGKYKVNVTFDSNTEVDSNEQFEYLPDPVIKATEPAELKSISSGGTTFNVIGEGFTAIDSLTVGVEDSEERDSTCRIITQTKLECKYPRNRKSEKRRKKRASISYIVIYLDGFYQQFPSSVLYVDDPLFAAFNDNTTYNFDPNVEESIKLVGKGLTTVTRKNDYRVYVGSGECSITNLNDSELICRPPYMEPSASINGDREFVWIC